jgi:hypothetical protein
MRHEMEEVEAAKMCDKLACYERTRGGVIQKRDTTKASAPKVNPSSLTPKDLVHLVDVSVAIKYGADLVQLMHVLAEDMQHMLDSYKQDLDNGLMRQFKLVVKEVMGNA